MHKLDGQIFYGLSICQNIGVLLSIISNNAKNKRPV